MVQFSSVPFSHSVMSNSLRPHGMQHTRPPCPSPAPGVYSNSCPSSQWGHPTISFSVTRFSSCLQFFPASRSFQTSQFFPSGSQSIGVSASTSVLPINIQDWFPLGWAGWISLQSKGLSRVFSNTTVQNGTFVKTEKLGTSQASPVAQLVKNLPAMWETWVQSLGWEDPLEKGKTAHFSILV